jgi:hypothetical protein
VLPDVRSPGLLQVDGGLQKFFDVREGVRVQIRAEAFNLMNRANLGAPDVGFLSTAFGSINSAGSPRTLQFGAKLAF